MRRQSIKVGVTGGYCSGKSSVLTICKRYNADIINMEKLLRDLMENNRRFTDDLSLVVDPAWAKAMQSPSGRRDVAVQLMAMHPDGHPLLDSRVQRALKEELKKFLYSPFGADVRLVEDPLVFEADNTHLYDEVWYIDCPVETQVGRYVQQHRVPEEKARETVLRYGAMADEKKAKSNRVIDNSTDMRHVEDQVKQALETIRFLGNRR